MPGLQCGGSPTQASVVAMKDSLPELEVTLADVGERAALSAIFPLLPHGENLVLGPGDDSAIVALGQSQVVISCDMMIEGPDFNREWSSPVDIGRKAIASNAADIAAMGATVVAYEIAVAAPPTTKLADLVDLASGFARGIAELSPGASIAGGDLSTAPVLTIAVTVLGELLGTKAVTRSGAKPGDVVAVGGDLGLSATGLRALEQAGSDRDVIAALVADNAAVRHHLAPVPPLHLGPQAGVAGASAMMDISDGLVLDATRMARASVVDIDLDHALLTKALGANNTISEHDALYGGEDHSLLACFPPDAVIPEGFVMIGRVVESPGSPRVTYQGKDLSLDPGGWDPFQDASADW